MYKYPSEAAINARTASRPFFGGKTIQHGAMLREFGAGQRRRRKTKIQLTIKMNMTTKEPEIVDSTENEVHVSSAINCKS